jgi:hypothetical protein
MHLKAALALPELEQPTGHFSFLPPMPKFLVPIGLGFFYFYFFGLIRLSIGRTSHTLYLKNDPTKVYSMQSKKK